MILKIVDAPTQMGGKALALCDDDGVILPQQVKCHLVQRLDGSDVTVTFRIDGDDVRFA